MEIYCPYTNELFNQSDITPDHILPKSLGGVDEFVVKANRDFNAKSGSHIEGKVVNDPLIQLHRYFADARGHSNKKVSPTWKNSKLGNKPVQVKIADKLQIWDSVERKYLEIEEYAGQEISSTFRSDLFNPINLAAKIALGSIYYAGQKAAIQSVNSEGLRWLMNNDIYEASKRSKSQLPLCVHDIQIVHRFHPDLAKPMGQTYKFLTEFSNRSIVILDIYRGKLAIHIGILSHFFCTLAFNANTSEIRHAINNDLGVVYLLGPGKYEEISLEEYSNRALNKLAK